VKPMGLIFVSAILMCSAHCVNAQTKSSGQRSAPTNEPSSYVDQVNLLEAQTQILQRQATLRSLLQQAASSDMDAGLPRILAIFGFEHALVAKLSLPDGSARTFRENQWINDYIKIASISDGGVIVIIKNKKHPIQLAFAPTANSVNRPPPSPTSVPDAMLPPAPYVPMPLIEPAGRDGASAHAIAVVPAK